MNNFKAILLLMMSATLIDASASPDCKSPQMATLESVVRFSDSAGVRASAVVIGSGLVLTAAHVVHLDTHARISGINGRWREATVIALDVPHDLALLAADTRGIAPIPISEYALRLSQGVWAAGYPRNGDLTISDGQYLSPRDGRLQTDAYIDSGQSGGALFTCNGGNYALAGIIHGYLAANDGKTLRNTGESVIVAASTVRQFIQASRTVATSK